MYTVDFYLFIHEKKWHPLNATTWESLEIIMLSEINQTQKDKYCPVLYVTAKNVDFTEATIIMAA